MPLTAARIRDLFTYDQNEGRLRWRAPSGRWGRIAAGSKAGGPNGEGYWYVTIDGRNYRSCRLIWLYTTGEWPEHQIDHIDNDKANDKWANLRQATQSQNKRNSLCYRSNLLGLKGVSRRATTGRYQAGISINGRRIYLGDFDTPEQAHAVHVATAKAEFGEFANSGARQ